MYRPNLSCQYFNLSGVCVCTGQTYRVSTLTCPVSVYVQVKPIVSVPYLVQCLCMYRPNLSCQYLNLSSVCVCTGQTYRVSTLSCPVSVYVQAKPIVSVPYLVQCLCMYRPNLSCQYLNLSSVCVCTGQTYRVSTLTCPVSVYVQAKPIVSVP